MSREIPAVLIGMGKMTPESLDRLKSLTNEARRVIVEEYRGPTDYRLYLQYPPGSPLANFSKFTFNSGDRSQNVSNCIGFAQWMFPNIIECAKGRFTVLEPGMCHGKPPNDISGNWCRDSRNCAVASEEPPGKRRRISS